MVQSPVHYCLQYSLNKLNVRCPLHRFPLQHVQRAAAEAVSLPYDVKITLRCRILGPEKT